MEGESSQPRGPAASSSSTSLAKHVEYIIADNDSNAHYPPHTHGGLTTHLIRQGALTISYPDDNDKLHGGDVRKETFGVGARVDVPAGKRHEVWIGDEGCEYVIGE